MKTGYPMPPPLVCGLHTAERAVAPYRFEDNVLYQCQCAHAGSISGALERVKRLNGRIVDCLCKPIRVSKKRTWCKESMIAVMMHVSEAHHLLTKGSWAAALPRLCMKLEGQS